MGEIEIRSANSIEAGLLGIIGCVLDVLGMLMDVILRYIVEMLMLPPRYGPSKMSFVVSFACWRLRGQLQSLAQRTLPQWWSLTVESSALL